MDWGYVHTFGAICSIDWGSAAEWAGFAAASVAAIFTIKISGQANRNAIDALMVNVLLELARKSTEAFSTRDDDITARLSEMVSYIVKAKEISVGTNKSRLAYYGLCIKAFLHTSVLSEIETKAQLSRLNSNPDNPSQSYLDIKNQYKECFEFLQLKNKNS